MTAAILLAGPDDGAADGAADGADDGSEGAADVGAGSSRLVRALREQGVSGPLTVLAAPSLAELLAELSRLGAAGPVAVARADVAVSGTALGALLDDPRVRTGVLCAPATAGASLATRDGLVTGVGGTADAAHLGVLRVHPDDVDAAAAVLADTPQGADPMLALTAALVAGGARPRAVPLGGFAWARPAVPQESEQAWQRVRGLDEHRVRLAEAARSGDGLYSSFVVRKISRRLTVVALRLHLQPDEVTLVSLALGLLAAGCFGTGARGWLVAGALLLQLALVVDCVDGELARYRRRFSARGAWLDATADRVKELAALAGLAAAAASGGDDVWLLAAAAVALQAFRNLFDLGWGMQRADDAAARAAAQAPPPMPGVEALADPGPAVRLAPAAAGPGPAVWVRRVAHLPVGERLLIMSVGAALGAPRGALLVLLGLGALSALYMLAAFAVRARPALAPSPRLAGLTDLGLLRRALEGQLTSGRRYVPALPAALAVLELGGVVWLAWLLDGPRPAAYGLVAAIAFEHYQRGYALRDASTVSARVASEPSLLPRLLLVAVISAFGGAPWMWVLAGVVALRAVVESVIELRRSRGERG